MSDETFNIKFSEEGASTVIQRMREMTSEGQTATQSVENLSDALGRVRNKANPAQAAYENLAKGIGVLDKAQKANLITGAEQNRLQTNLIAQSERALRPFSTLVSGIQSETRAWGENATARATATRVMAQTQTLQRAGVVLSLEEREALVAVNLAAVQAREAAQARATAERQAAAEAARAAAQRVAAADREAVATERRSTAISSLLGKIGQETEAVGLNTVERQANLRTIQQAESLRTIGITLSDEETAALQRQNLEYAQQREAVSVLARTQRELQAVRQIGASPVESARIRQAQASNTVSQAEDLGLIGKAEAARLERNITAAYAEQVNPLIRTSQLLRERVGYITGVSESGRALAAVERDIARAQAEGAGASVAAINGLRAQAREVDKLDKAYSSLKEAKGFFNTFIGGFGLLLGAGASLKALDETTQVRNLVGVTSTGKDNNEDVTKKVYETALATHSEVEDTAKLYTRLALAASRYNIGQQQTLDLTKEVNQQIRLSGTSQGEATRAVLDFAHSIGAGNVQFREFRALATQAPFVVVQIGKGLSELAKQSSQQGRDFLAKAKAAGVDPTKRPLNVSDIKELTSKKALSAGDVISAQRLEAASTQEAFDKLQPTIAQSATDLKTFFLEYVDGFNKASGAGAGVANLIEFVGKNLKTIIPVAIVAGSVLAGLFIAEKVREFTNLISVFGGRLVGVRTGIAANTVATEANNVAIGENSALQAINAREIDLVTASLIRQNLARAGATAATGVESAIGPGVVAARATAGAAGVAASEAGALSLGGIAAGATAAIPLILGLGAAYLVLKDSISLADDKTVLAFKNQATGQAEAIQGNVTLGDAVSGVFDLLNTKATESGEHQKAVSKDTADADAKAKQDQLDAAKASFDKTGDSYGQLHNKLLKGIVDQVSAFGIGAIAISTAFRVLFDNIILGFEAVGQYIVNAFADIYNNTAVKVANFAKDHGIGGGLPTAGHVDFTSGRLATRDKDQAEGNRATVNAIRELPNRLAGSIINAAGRRQTVRPSSITNNPGDLENDEAAGKNKKAKKDPLENEFDALLKKTLPLVSAIQDFGKAMDTLKKAVDKGYVQKAVDFYNNFSKGHPEDQLGTLSTPELTSRITASANRELQDKIFPGNAFDREQTEKQNQLKQGGNDPFQRTLAREATVELDKEAKALALTIDEYKKLRPLREGQIQSALAATSAAEQQDKVNQALRAENQERELQRAQIGQTTELTQAQNQAYAIYKDQLLAGVAGARAAYEQRVRDNVAYIAYNENLTKTKAAYDAIVAPGRQYQDTLVNLNNLLDSGSISLQKYNSSVRDATSALLAGNKDGFSGFERGVLAVKKESEDAAADMQATFTDAYHNIEDGFESLFTGGNLKDALHKTLEGLTKDFSKALFHKLTDPLVGDLGSKFGIAGFGDKKTAAQRADITATNVYVNGADAKSLGNLGLKPADGSIPGVAGGDLSSLAFPKAGNDNSLTDALAQIGIGGPSKSDTAGLNSALADLGIGAGAGGGGGDPIASLLGGLSGSKGGGGATGGLSSLFSLIGGGGGAGGGGFDISSLFQFASLFGFAEGGTGTVTGSGGTDSKLIQFMATPGENFEVKTPAQQRESAGGEAPQVNSTIINTMDPQAALDAMSTGPGYNVVLNHIQSNPEQIKRALGL